MDQQRTKDLFYKYNFCNFAVFCAETINVLHKILDYQEFRFSNCCGEFNAYVKIKKKQFAITLFLESKTMVLTKECLCGRRTIWTDNSTDLYNLHDSLLSMYRYLLRNCL